jgi:hypothetical protein
VEGKFAVGGVVKLVGGDGLELGFPEALSTVRNQGLATSQLDRTVLYR